MILPGVDEIETDPFKCIAGNVKGLQGFIGGMDAPQFLKVPIVQCLDPHGYPVHPAGTITGKTTGFDGSGIGFERDF